MSGSVVVFGKNRPLESLNRFRELPMLSLKQPYIKIGFRVVRIDLQRSLKLLCSLVMFTEFNQRDCHVDIGINQQWIPPEGLPKMVQSQTRLLPLQDNTQAIVRLGIICVERERLSIFANGRV